MSKYNGQFDKIAMNDLVDIPLINGIRERMGFDDPHEAIEAVKYNIITPLNLSLITGKKISTIQNLMRPRQTREGFKAILTKVFPHKLGNSAGPVFVFFDKNCYDYIVSTFKPKNNSDGRINKITKGERGSEDS